MKTKKLLALYFILLMIVIFLFISYFRLSQVVEPNRTFEEIKKEGVLHLVTEYNQIGYYVSGDTIEGFQYDLSKAIADISGLEIQTHLEMSLENSFDLLDRKEVDVIARNIPISEKMRDKYLFTEPVFFNKQVLVQRTALSNNGIEPLRNQLDLAGKTLYVPVRSSALLRLHNLEQEIGDSINIVESKDYSTEQLLIMVAKGDIEFAVCDYQIALHFLRKYSNIDIETDISFTQLQSWAVRKDCPILRDSLNSWLKQIKQKGLFQKIYQRYY